MAEKDEQQDPDGPSLELPSLGFRRKRRAKRDEPTPADAPSDVAPPAPTTPSTQAPPREPRSQPAVQPEVRPEAQPEVQAATTRGAPLFADEARTAPAPTYADGATTEQLPTTRADEDDDPDREPGVRTRSLPTLPTLGPVPAALVTGLLVGVITVGLVWVSQRLCELVRGTSSCGDAGFFLLLAVLVVAGLVGGSLLRAFGVAEGGGTSFLAMSLVAVLLMLVLVDHLFAWWMILAVPAVAMIAYVLAHRVTTAMVEPGGPEMHR